MAQQPIDAELKAQVAGALLAGLGVSEVSRRYSLPKTTVHRIKSALPQQVAQGGEETRESLNDLLVAALGANLKAQTRIAEVASEAEFIRGQGPGALAELYQALASHSVRLLEAAALSEAGEEPA